MLPCLGPETVGEAEDFLTVDLGISLCLFSGIGEIDLPLVES